MLLHKSLEFANGTQYSKPLGSLLRQVQDNKAVLQQKHQQIMLPNKIWIFQHQFYLKAASQESLQG